MRGYLSITSKTSLPQTKALMMAGIIGKTEPKVINDIMVAYAT